MADSPTRRFAVAFSFAAPEREYVERLDAALRPYFTEAQVFLYTRHLTEHAGPELDDWLHAVYAEQTEVVVACLSQAYVQSKWTGVEGRSVKKIIFDGNGDRVVVVRFDLTVVPQIQDYDAYLSATTVPVETIAQAVAAAHRRVTAPDWRKRPASVARPSNLPHRSIGTLFKGRDGFLADLRERLTTTPDLPRVLFGLGGVGKTRLALEYAHRHAAEHSALLFITADAPDILEANIAALAHPRILNLAEQHAGSLADQVAAVLRWLAMHPGWLLIVDNVDTDPAAKAVQELLSQLRGGQVVITSRVDHWGRSVERLNVDVLSRESSTDFLLERTAGERITSPDDWLEASTLSDELGGLALGLEQAGAYIEEEAISIAEYRSRWQRNHAEVFAWFDEQRTAYPRSVAVTWQTSVNQLSSAGLALLRLCSLMGPAIIPAALFRSTKATNGFADLAHQIASEAPSETSSRPVTFSEGLKQLRRFALARLTDGGGFDIHRLVQDVTADRLPIAHREAIITALVEWLVGFAPDTPHDPATWAIWDTLLPHVNALWPLVKDDLTTGARLDLGDSLAAYLFGKARYDDSRSLDEILLPATEKYYGSNSGQVAHVLTGLGEARRLGGDTGEDLVALFERALTIERTIHGPQSARVASALNYVGLAWKRVGRLDRAERAYRQALSIYDGLSHPSTHRLALVLDNLGHLLRVQGSVDEAAALSERAVALARNVSGSPHIYLCQFLINYAKILMLGSRALDAERAALEAVRAAEPYGPEHDFAVTAHATLSDVLESQDKWKESVEHRRAVVDALRRTAPDAGKAIAAMHNLAHAQWNAGAGAEAVASWREALRAKERLTGVDDAETVIILHALALGLEASGDLAGSEALLRRELDARERLRPADDVNTLTCAGSLANLLYAKGDLAGAEPLRRRLVEAKERREDGSKTDLAVDLNNHALLLRKLGRFSEAAEYLRRAIAIEDVHLSSRHPKRAHRRNNLAVVLMLAGHVDDAVDANTEAWDLKAHVCEGGHDVTSARVLVVRVALQWLTGIDPAASIGALRTLLTWPALPCHGGIEVNWDARDILNEWQKRLSAEQVAVLAALVDALNDGSRLNELDHFPMWRSQPAVGLEDAMRN
jgi:tetratricopeptide (TPR) repeat protein